LGIKTTIPYPSWEVAILSMELGFEEINNCSLLNKLLMLSHQVFGAQA